MVSYVYKSKQLNIIAIYESFQTRSQQTLFVKGKIVNTLGFGGHMVISTTT